MRAQRESSDMAVEDEAASWFSARRRARDLSYNTEVEVSKLAETSLPSDMDLRESRFPYSVAKGAQSVYREDTPGEHFHIREYSDRWTIELDRSNPHYQPISHALTDASEYTALAVVATIALASFGVWHSEWWAD